VADSIDRICHATVYRIAVIGTCHAVVAARRGKICWAIADTTVYPITSLKAIAQILLGGTFGPERSWCEYTLAKPVSVAKIIVAFIAKATTF
jgi:hypothetical protein